MASENNNTPFLPAFDEWARMYAQWLDETASADRFEGIFDELMAA